MDISPDEMVISPDVVDLVEGDEGDTSDAAEEIPSVNTNFDGHQMLLDEEMNHGAVRDDEDMNDEMMGGPMCRRQNNEEHNMNLCKRGIPGLYIKSDDYKLDDDGSITLSVKLDKDQVQCCICYTPMTSSIFRCRSLGKIKHNVCGSCEWKMRRTKQSNGHLKTQCCPICKAKGGLVRNTHLERQLYDLSTFCTNHNKGCRARFFPWDKELLKDHLNECTFAPAKCPICTKEIKAGASGFPKHILNNQCSRKFFPGKIETNRDRHQIVKLTAQKSYYVINESCGYMILFTWNKSKYWEAVPIQLHVKSNLQLQGGLNHYNNKHSLGNNQVYFSYAYTQEIEEYETRMKSESLLMTENLTIPQHTQIRSMIFRLYNVNSKRKIQKPSIGRIYCLDSDEDTEMTIRFFSLLDSISLGSTLDCRDFTGKWYEAEVIKITAVDIPSCALSQRYVSSTNRRFCVHYLGYSANYDEWFDVIHDSHRIAHRGTHTVGPNLRVVRRCEHQQHTQQQQHQHHQHQHAQAAN